jgi:hypothetical protein
MLGERGLANSWVSLLLFPFEKIGGVVRKEIEFAGAMETISYEKQILYYYLFGQFAVPGP